MAVRLDADTDILTRVTGLAAFGSMTAVYWFYRSVDTNGVEVLWYWSMDSGVSAGYFGSYIEIDKVWADTSLGGGGATGTTTLNVGQWYRAAQVFNSVAQTSTFYLDGAQEMQATGMTGGAFTPAYEMFGRIGTSFFNGRVAAIKVWTAVLSLAEITQEWRQYLPVRLANLHRFTPLLKHTDLVDYSGITGVAWTAGGTLTTEDGPPIPWRHGRRRAILPAGAVVLPDLTVSLEEPAILISTF